MFTFNVGRNTGYKFLLFIINLKNFHVTVSNLTTIYVFKNATFVHSEKDKSL